MKTIRRSSIKAKPVLFTSKTYKDNSNPILIRLTSGKNLAYISIGHTARPENWNKIESKVYESKPRINLRQQEIHSKEELARLKIEYSKAVPLKNGKKVNDDITIELGRVKEIIEDLEKSKKPFSLRVIQELYNGQIVVNENSFLIYADKKIKEEEDQGRIATYKKFKTVFEKFKEFINKKKKMSDLVFDDLTADLLREYQGYLLTDEKKKNAGNTVHNNMKAIRTILYKAIKEDHLFEQSKNPFFNFTITSYKNPQKQKLSPEEISAIQKLNLPKNSRINDARNCFMFCFYNAGIRISDLLRLKWGYITSEGRLEYQMVKQGGNQNIKLRPESIKIINQYKKKDSQDDDYIFPFLPKGIEEEDNTTILNQISAKTSLINKNLKLIGKKLKLQKPLSTHIARHSFANLARKKDVSIYEISQAMNHSSIKVTEEYLKTLPDESLDKALDKTFAGL